MMSNSYLVECTGILDMKAGKWQALLVLLSCFWNHSPFKLHMHCSVTWLVLHLSAYPVDPVPTGGQNRFCMPFGSLLNWIWKNIINECCLLKQQCAFVLFTFLKINSLYPFTINLTYLKYSSLGLGWVDILIRSLRVFSTTMVQLVVLQCCMVVFLNSISVSL